MASDESKSLVLSYKFALLKLQYTHGIPIEKKGNQHRLTKNKHVKRNYTHKKKSSDNNNTQARHKTETAEE